MPEFAPTETPNIQTWQEFSAQCAIGCRTPGALLVPSHTKAGLLAAGTRTSISEVQALPPRQAP